MFSNTRLASAIALGALLTGTAASAATVTGTITDSSSLGLAQMEVRLWLETPKGNSLAQTVVTNPQGAYSFTGVPAGNYKLDARMGPLASGNWADRWYDVAPPTSNGYVGKDADVIAIQIGDALTGFDLTLEQAGGFDGMVTVNNVAFAGAQVRAEQAQAPAIHHNDLSQDLPHRGEFSLRGMVPATDYRFFAHDPSGLHETLVAEGPFTVSQGVVTWVPPLALLAMGTDPLEPANQSASVPDLTVDATTPWASTDAIISPRNAGDTDWYCFQASAGDRFLIHAESLLPLASGTRENPFVDPVVALYSGDGQTLLAEDDDSGPGVHDALLDTGILASTDRYCAVVSTFGDIGYAGYSQTSAGRYTVGIAMGNRKPTLTVTSGGLAVPVPPATLTTDEGSSVTLDLVYGDPDNDPVNLTASLVDANGTPVTTATFSAANGTGTFTWMPDQTAAKQSPYTVTLEVADAEFTVSQQVVIAVNSVNLPPETPMLAAPADTSVSQTAKPTFTLQNSTDPDGDPLGYEVELYYGTAPTAAETLSAPEDPTGQTSFYPTTDIPENTVVRWRARAFDGNTTSAYSAWSDEWHVFIDTRNDPPSAPKLTKPDDGETVMSRRPALSVENPVDPENDAMTVVFEVAQDASFAQGLFTSPEVPVSTTGNTTTWNVPEDLPWGTTWYARAYAKDARGGTSLKGNVHLFHIQPDSVAATPTFGAPFDAQCHGVQWTNGLAQLSVGPVTDPDGEPVQVQLQILPFDADPSGTAPAYDRTQAQASSGPTTFDLSGMHWEEDVHYRVRVRAGDGFAWSEWSECDATVNAKADVKPGGDDGGVKQGCGCTSGGESLALAMGLAVLAFAARRRRQV